MTKKQFLCDYIKAIREGNAAVFAGAGLSRPSGYVVWKDLLKPLTDNIGLNIEDEHDLTIAAQYVRNKSGNRAAINASILDEFGKSVEINPNVEIITRLPIETYWTTNYDRLIEEGLRKANRNADVKIESRQLSVTKKDRDAVVYKMHGDAEHAANAVLTKDDYIQYEKNYPFFRKVLQGDLISKTFLFIGFSFEDPNFDSVMCQIKLSLEENLRNHYCIMRRVSKDDIPDETQFGYKLAQQQLREEDLARYGIQTVFVDDYSEITGILSEIETAVLVNNVFISGSASFYSEEWTQDKLLELASALANRLVKDNFRIASGFGNDIGSAVINGALTEIYANRYKHLNEHLRLYPFPQTIEDEDERIHQRKKYREQILSENGVVIFIAGNKLGENNEKQISSGCIQEFEIAKEYGCLIIPIGTTGDASKLIFDEIKSNITKYRYLEKHLDVLEKESNIERIIEEIILILKEKRIV